MLRELDFATEADIFGQLRYDVFVNQLGWVKGDPTRGVELDKLDSTAHHLGVMSMNNRLDGYARVIQGGTPGGLLLEQPEFAPLFPAGLLVDDTTGEVSRLCVRPGRLPTDIPADADVVQMLVREIYDLAMVCGIVTLYATTNDTKRGYINRSSLERLSFLVVAGPHQFQPGIDTYLLALDLKQASTDPFFRHYLKL